MEKNKSILIAILSGIVACFVCVGIIFLFPKNNMKGNVDTPNDGYELIVGDQTTCSHTDYYCASGTQLDGQCVVDHGAVSTFTGYECPSQYVEVNDRCYEYLGIQATARCTACFAGSYLSGGACYTCSEGYTSDGGSATSCYRNSCPAGQYLDSSHSTGCADCPSSKYCPGGDALPQDCSEGYSPNASHTACYRTSCPAGQGLDPSATTGCSDCAVGYYSGDNDGECHKCPTGYTSAAGSTKQTDCYMNVTAGNQLLKNASAQTPCADGYINTAETTKVNYGGAKECTKCTKGTSNAEHTACEGDGCGVGQGKDTSATTGCSACSPGYYSNANDDECHKCPSGKFSPAGSGESGCKEITAPCCENPYGSSHTISDVYGCKQAVAAGATVVAGACPETTNPVVTSVVGSYSGSLYLTPTDYQGYGYKLVTYVAYDQKGNVIPGDKLSWNAVGDGVIVSSSKNANGFAVTYKGLPCKSPSVTPTVTATGTNGATGSKSNSSITIVADSTRYKEWTLIQKNVKKGNYVLMSEAYATNNCRAVADYNAETDRYNLYSRCCGDGGGTPATFDFCCAATDGSDYRYFTGQNKRECPTNYTIDESKDANSCKLVKIPACYKDSDNNYYWTDAPANSWVIVSEITKEADCKANEDPACYKNPSGGYEWGTFAKTVGYTKITSIDTEAMCHAPTPSEACYKNSSNNYVWAASAPSGYTKVEGVTKPEDCKSDEPEACYLYNNEFVWGKYSNVTGYIILEDVKTKEACKTPKAPACYKNPDGNYVWGEYNDLSGYTLIPSITNVNQCNNDVPTPATGLDVSKAVYVFMAVLMAFGIGFIYYSSVMKKENQ